MKTPGWQIRTTVALGALLLVQGAGYAQNNNGGATPAGNVVGQAGNAAGQAVGAAGNVAGQAAGAAGNVVNQAGNVAGNVAGQLPGTVGQVGDAAGNIVGGLQPTLQPVGQGVGNALNNLTQPDTVRSLLEFLAGVIPNHIEAHVQLDALRVGKVTVDIRDVDLRNLHVDLLVANSRNAGQVRPAMGPGSEGYGTGTSNGTGTGGTGTGSLGGSTGTNSGGIQLPGDTPIAGSSSRGTSR